MSFAEDSFSTDSEDENALEESDSENEQSDEAETLRNELAEVPLGQLRELKNKIGLKRYNEALFGKSRNKMETLEDGDGRADAKRSTAKLSAKAEGDDKKPTKQMNAEKISRLKSEPEEISSKKKFAHKKPRLVVRNNKPSLRDPRFSDLSGHLNEELFEKSYAFVRDIKDKEYDTVKKKLRKVRNENRRADLLKLKQKLDSDLKREQEKKSKREKTRKRKHEEIERVKQGKKAFYLKTSHQKKIELAEKFRELKATGKLESYMKNKRKRKATKEKKNLPITKIT